MNCPTCGEKMKPLDKVCRGCHFMPEAGRVIDLEPPRTTGLRKWWNRWATPRRIGRFLSERFTRSRAVTPRSVVIAMVAGLVPGLGHFYLRKYVFGIVFMLAAGGSLGAAFQVRGDDVVRILLGFACALHAVSLLDLMSGSLKNHIANRMFAMGGLITVLGAVIYWPLMRSMTPPPTRMVNHGHAIEIFDGMGTLFYAVFGFIAVSYIAHQIAKLIPRRKSTGSESEGKDYGSISHP